MIFVAWGNDDKLGRVWRLVFDRFFNRRYGKVGVCGKCFKRWYSVVQCQSVCREFCPDNPCLDENTLRAKHPYVMLSSHIYPRGEEIEHLQKVEKKYMENFGVPKGFNPSEDFESEKFVQTILVSMKTLFGQSIHMRCFPHAYILVEGR